MRSNGPWTENGSVPDVHKETALNGYQTNLSQV